MATTEPFDKHRGAYEAWFEHHGPAYESELAAIEALLPMGDICEVGVGTGRFAAPLGVRLGIDPSAAMLELAARRGIQTAIAAAEALPFRSASLDGILMVTTICFLDDPNEAFREAARVLKPKGALVLGFVDLASPLGQAYQRRKASSQFYGPARFWRAMDLITLLKTAGFEIRETLQTLFGPMDSMKKPDPPRPGYGQGAFVAIQAVPSRISPSRRVPQTSGLGQ